ncbi:pyridoxamine 5'-phosphate oxidase family protein [Micromonospora sp. NPDC050417]|uniref:pyridoxamine 5'-phosphate oxidase family protein n=1 Tax=Micromonospora sp. NPDC050417 TaxID=3364280 RepID=UPI0037A50569
MTARIEPVAELLFAPEDAVPMSTDSSTIVPWTEAVERLAAAGKVWLATSRASGQPHVQPVLAVWLDVALYVSTRPGSVKGRNLARDGRCAVTVSTEQLDLVVEGVARPTRADRMPAVVAAFEAAYQWRFTLSDGKVLDSSLPGSPEYVFYEISPTTAFGYGLDGLTATRWRF